MINLIDTLKKETESLKNQYVEMVEKWSIKDFDYLRQWANDYQNGKFGFGEASKKYYRLPYYIVNSNGKVEQHVEKMVKDAIVHYESSIEKEGFKSRKIKNCNISYWCQY